MATAAHKKELQRIHGNVEQAKADAETLAQELKEAWEAKSDKWKESETGLDEEKLCDDVQTFADTLESATNDVSEHVTA